MKKRNIILSVLFAAVGLTSCDMEKYPYNAVEESLYMTTANDFKSARIGLYSPYRTLTSGGHILTPEFQCADFHATASYRTRMVINTDGTSSLLMETSKLFGVTSTL